MGSCALWYFWAFGWNALKAAVIQSGGDCGSLMCGVVAVSSWCCHGSSCCCHIVLFVWLPCRPVGDVAPVSVCEKRMEEGSMYLPE